MKRSPGKIVVGAALALYASYAVADIAARPEAYHWDFKAYYYWTGEAAQGEYPYALSPRQWNAAAREGLLIFPYHPTVLWAFIPLTRFTYRTAYLVYLGLNVAAVAATVLLWRRAILGREAGVGFYLLCLAGFNAALYQGVRAGNINAFELLALWLAFLMFIRNRAVPFVLLVVLASLPKTLPAAFLALIFLLDAPRKRRLAGLAALVFVAVHALTFAIHPHLFVQYAVQKGQYMAMFDERGLVNPSTVPLLKDALEALTTRGLISPGLAPSLFLGAYLAVAAAVLLVTSLALSKVDRRSEAGRLAVVVLATLAYALVLPRFKDYAYSLLLVPAYIVIRRQTFVRPATLLLALVIAPYTCWTLPGLAPIAEALSEYFALLLALGLWLLAIRLAHAGALAPEKGVRPLFSAT